MCPRPTLIALRRSRSASTRFTETRAAPTKAAMSSCVRSTWLVLDASVMSNKHFCDATRQIEEDKILYVPCAAAKSFREEGEHPAHRFGVSLEHGHEVGPPQCERRGLGDGGHGR